MMCLWGLSLLFIQPLAAEETTAKDTKAAKKTPGASFTDSLSLTSRHEPIHISSRDLEFRYDEKRIVYRGDVVAVQGDVTMKSDLLTVFYEDSAPAAATPQTKTEEQEKAGETPKTNNTKQRLKEIIAEGHVDITSGDRRATGKKAVFNEAQRTVVLSGDAVVIEGGNQVTGERVTVYLDEKRSVVEGGEGNRRAEMVLIPEQEGEGKKGAKKP
jgi:lipopolysaccharide export system protein LptA